MRSSKLRCQKGFNLILFYIRPSGVPIAVGSSSRMAHTPGRMRGAGGPRQATHGKFKYKFGLNFVLFVSRNRVEFQTWKGRGELCCRVTHPLLVLRGHQMPSPRPYRPKWTTLKLQETMEVVLW